METVAERAHRVLARQRTPALSTRELHRLLSGELGGPPPPMELFLHQLRRRPDLFRILEPWRGPWGPLLPSPRERSGSPGVAADLEIRGDLWVVPADGGGALDEEPDPAVRTLRASLLAVGRRVDDGSVTALTRWMAMVREARRVRRWIFQRRSAEATAG